MNRLLPLKTRIAALGGALLSLTICGNVFSAEDAQLDSYGGVMAYEFEPSGRFRLGKIGDRHCLITPEGHGFFSLGVTHTSGVARQAGEEQDWFAGKFNSDWEAFSQHTARNLSSWGYNNIGYDSPRELRQLLPYLASTHPTATSRWRPDSQFSFPDVFDPVWQEEAKKDIQVMVERERGNSRLIGYYWTDIPQWDLVKAKRMRGANWVETIRNLPDTAPGKIAYQAFAKENPDHTDEDFLGVIADIYYRVVGEENRRLDPEGIVFGERYLVGDFPEVVVKAALPWIDAIAFQPGGAKFDEKSCDRLYEMSGGKPIFLCDHQASFPTPLFRETMWQQLPDQEAVGEAHRQYLEAALAEPYILGYHRCQYVDRFKDRKGVLKQGLLKADGTPYEVLVKTVTENNRMALDAFAAIPTE